VKKTQAKARNIIGTAPLVVSVRIYGACVRKFDGWRHNISNGNMMSSRLDNNAT